MNVFVFGMGYSSKAAARALRETIDPELVIHGTTRDADNTAALELEGITAHVFDGHGSDASISATVADATHVIHSIAPNDDGDAVMRRHRDHLMASQNLEWLCYYSTVGVYGNFDGAWIDETAPCAPRNKRSEWRVAAEDSWRDFAAKKGIPLIILRLAGIYGPGRSALDKLKAGTARRIVKPGQVFNRIHVADIGRVTALAARQKLEGTFNLADDEPAPPQDLVSFGADLLGVDPPPEIPFAEADMTSMARSFYSDNKRVSNAAIKKALGIETLLYPSYREGLNAIYGTM